MSPTLCAPDTRQLELTAVHEAGHALMAHLCGQHLTGIDIVGDEELSGSVSSLRVLPDPLEVVDPNLPTAHLERRILCLLAGEVAERRAGGDRDWREGSADVDAAVRLAMRVVGDCSRVVPYLERASELVDEVLERHWRAVEALARAVERAGRMDGPSIRRAIRPYL